MELLKRHRVFLVALGLLLVLVFMLAWWHEDDRHAPSTDGQRSVLQEITRAVVLPFQQAVRSVSGAAGDVDQHSTTSWCWLRSAGFTVPASPSWFHCAGFAGAASRDSRRSVVFEPAVFQPVVLAGSCSFC